MKFEDLPRSTQYKTVFNSCQKKKIINRRLMSTLKELRELTALSAEFTEFNGTGHAKLKPLEAKAEIAEYYAKLKSALLMLDDPLINLWIENNDETSS